MGAPNLFWVQVLLLILGLAALYSALVSTYLKRKIASWALFQLVIVLLWATSLSRYHDQVNPFSLNILLVVLAASLGVLGLGLMLALGAAKRQGGWTGGKA